ncbi:hypothetical protein CR513_33551, partial [Mucuna pruriens]
MSIINFLEFLHIVCIPHSLFPLVLGLISLWIFILGLSKSKRDIEKWPISFHVIRVMMLHMCPRCGRLHCLSRTIVLDRGIKFLGHFWRTVSQLLRCFVKKSLRDRENWILHVEFAYNRLFYSTTSYSPFELAYDFNPLSPLDSVPLPVLPNCANDKGLHDKARLHMEKKRDKYAKNSNKGRKEVFFKEGDLVWVHLRKEKFPYHRKSKILPRGFGGSTTFNVIEGQVLHPCVVGTKVPNLRSNFLQEEEDDAYMGGHTRRTQEGKDEVATPALKGPMTRGRLKRIQEEVGQKLVMLKGQEEAQEGLIFHNVPC